MLAAIVFVCSLTRSSNLSRHKDGRRFAVRPRQMNRRRNRPVSSVSIAMVPMQSVHNLHRRAFLGR